jgi:hypothetical protein
VTHGANFNCAAIIVSASESQCGTFIHALVRNEVGIDTGLDLLTTITSAVSNVAGPAAVARGIGAVTTISSGSKTAIDSDVFAKASIANFAHTIQSTYYKDIASYQDDLNKKDDSQISPEFELSLIRPIHEECSLAAAEASISASVTPAASTGTSGSGGGAPPTGTNAGALPGANPAQPAAAGAHSLAAAAPASGARPQPGPSAAQASTGGRCRFPGHAVNAVCS